MGSSPGRIKWDRSRSPRNILCPQRERWLIGKRYLTRRESGLRGGEIDQPDICDMIAISAVCITTSTTTDKAATEWYTFNALTHKMLAIFRATFEISFVRLWSVNEFIVIFRP